MTKDKSQSALHVGIIMDGNGRWATRQGLPRVAGHRAGVAAVRRAVEHAPNLRIRVLTLYAFSSDNWARPRAGGAEHLLDYSGVFSVWNASGFARTACVSK